jgi:hypothetical protein
MLGDPSGLFPVIRPLIDSFGYIHAGRGRSDFPHRVIGRARLQHDDRGRAWWVAAYSDMYGAAKSPVRAQSRFDRAPSSASLNMTRSWQADPGSTSLGNIYQNASGTWYHRDLQGRLSPLSQTNSTAEYIELRDASRGLSLRIFPDGAAYLARGGQGWSYMTGGRWVR